jgi:hypothetical protein
MLTLPAKPCSLMIRNSRLPAQNKQMYILLVFIQRIFVPHDHSTANKLLCDVISVHIRTHLQKQYAKQTQVNSEKRLRSNLQFSPKLERYFVKFFTRLFGCQCSMIYYEAVTRYNTESYTSCSLY